MMKTEKLPDIPEEDDLSIIVEQLKNGLVSRATGGDFPEDEYKRLRKIVLGITDLSGQMPRFLKTCRTLDEFWPFIKSQSDNYAGRRQYLGEVFNPILDKLEYEIGEGALEFRKNYEEKQLIGQGGFGQVYLFEHRLLKMPFAVKVFAPAFYEGGEKEMERFFQEAKMLFKLNHPNIIKIYDAGLIGNRPFIRMEYFEGQNLNQVLTNFGLLSPSKAIPLIQNIVEAIEYAHKIGIIHRDLKPSNIMVSKPNKFRIIDFGLGVFIENELHSRLTKTGDNIISGYFNAPELIENPKLIDVKSDIYSIGAIWYNMLTGQPPAGTGIEETIVTIEGIDNRYSQIIIKCLSHFDNRYNDCSELLFDLQKII